MSVSPGWQPIETAPRDRRTSVLLFNPERATMHVGRWNARSRSAPWQQFEILDANFLRLAVFYPTHWMPLPEPPVE